MESTSREKHRGGSRIHGQSLPKICLARGNAARAFDAGVCDNARRKLIIFHGERGPERLPFIIGWHLHAVFTLIEV